MDRLIELAERVEQASEHDQRELLIEAFKAIHGEKPRRPTGGSPEWLAWLHLFNPFFKKLEARASLDAAMSLVPEGCAVDFRRFANGKARAVVWRTVTHPEPPFEHPCERAASAALAITAASLRARATKEQTND